MTADDGAIADAAIPVVESWACAFPSGSPRVVTVLPPCTWPTAEAPSSSEVVGEFVQRLADRGVVASLDVLRERDPRQALLAPCCVRRRHDRRRDEPPLPRRSLPLV